MILITILTVLFTTLLLQLIIHSKSLKDYENVWNILYGALLGTLISSIIYIGMYQTKELMYLAILVTIITVSIGIYFMTDKDKNIDTITYYLTNGVSQSLLVMSTFAYLVVTLNVSSLLLYVVFVILVCILTFGKQMLSRLFAIESIGLIFILILSIFLSNSGFIVRHYKDVNLDLRSATIPKITLSEISEDNGYQIIIIKEAEEVTHFNSNYDRSFYEFTLPNNKVIVYEFPEEVKCHNSSYNDLKMFCYEEQENDYTYLEINVEGTTLNKNIFITTRSIQFIVVLLATLPIYKYKQEE